MEITRSFGSRFVCVDTNLNTLSASVDANSFLQVILGAMMMHRGVQFADGTMIFSEDDSHAAIVAIGDGENAKKHRIHGYRDLKIAKPSFFMVQMCSGLSTEQYEGTMKFLVQRILDLQHA